MFELEDGTMGTLAAPAPQPRDVKNALSYDSGESMWSPIGVTISQSKSLLSYPPAWQAIRQISGDGSSLNCNLQQRDENGDWVTQELNPVHRLMNRQSNGIQTAAIWKEAMWHHHLWLGDGRSFIVRDGSGVPMELIPLLPDRTWTVLIEDQATRRTYKYHLTNIYPNHMTREQGRQQFVNPYDTDSYMYLPDEDVFHFPGMSFDGISGYVIARMFKRTLGIGVGTEGKVAVGLERSGVPPLVLKAPAGVFRTEEEAREFLRNWNEYHSGIVNSGKTGLLRQGIEPHLLNSTNREEQFEELKKITRQDAASIWNIPVQMLGDTDASTFNNTEHMWKTYRLRTLSPPMCKWNQEADKKLLSVRQKQSGNWRWMYDDRPLQFIDIDSRAKYYDMGRKNNAFSGDDIREMEGMPRLNLPETSTYENPNTSSGATSTESQAGNEATASAENTLRLRCHELAMQESDKIESAADCKHLETFARRIDKHYSLLAQRYAGIVDKYGGNSDRVAEYCTNRRDEIMRAAVAAGHSKIEEDTESVAESIYNSFFGRNGHA